MAYTTFCRLWQTLVPYLEPMTDLCWQCQQNSAALSRTANNSLAEKTAAVRAYLEHLELVQKGRSYYKSQCDSCKNSLQDHLKKSPATISLFLYPPRTQLTLSHTILSITLSRWVDTQHQLFQCFCNLAPVCMCVCVCVRFKSVIHQSIIAHVAVKGRLCL